MAAKTNGKPPAFIEGSVGLKASPDNRRESASYLCRCHLIGKLIQQSELS